MDGFNGSPELVRDIQFVGVKEEDNPEVDLKFEFVERDVFISPVHSFSKPLEDANEIVASVDSLFFPGEDSRRVNHCHTLQHWALDNRALEPGQSFIKGREGMKKAVDLLRKAPPNLVRGRNCRDLSTAKAFPGIT